MDTDKMPVGDVKSDNPIPASPAPVPPPRSPRSLTHLLSSTEGAPDKSRRTSPPRFDPQEPPPLSDARLDASTPRANTPVVAPRPMSTGVVPQPPVEENPPPHSAQRSRRASPMDNHNYSAGERTLNVADALSYLDNVKNQFQEQPDVYNHFLDIMKEFKNEQIDTPGVIQRVSYLFHGHPHLIQGFNTFLPAGYRIECSTEGPDAGYITVTTPNGVTTQSINGPPRQQQQPWRPGVGPGFDVGMAPPSPIPRAYTPVEGQAIEPAVQYVQKIKQRCDPETYRQFLDILARYHHAPDTIDEEEVSRQVARLFKDAPDLRQDFRIFMPNRSQQFFDEAAAQPSPPDKSRRKLDAVANAMGTGLPQKRKRRPAEKEREREREKELAASKAIPPPTKKSKAAPVQDIPAAPYPPKHVSAVPTSPRRTHQQLPPPVPIAQPTRLPIPNDDLEFFDRVRRAIGDQNIYNEFLKIVNLFAQDYIDTARLVKQSKSFLGETELFSQFCDILGWDEKKERESYLAEQNSQSSWTKPAQASLPERPGRIDLNEKYGSYRKVSADEANISCAGRDEMCRSVLNDEWVSHPTWTSDDSGFVAHKKNVYEEALHRSEEERHEYDFHIDAIVRTINYLEPLSNRIASMSNEDRANFKLKANFGGQWKAIYQRVIKKIYGREAGVEVVKAMQEQPVKAIPVVLSRLKLKEEEWKRAQREWNRVWREVDARNYAKSLDHQAITFKAADKKALTTKAFVSQIETARAEQVASRASLIDPLFARTTPRYQLAFIMEDDEVLQTVLKLTLSFLDRTQSQISPVERKRIENFLRTFFPLFFCLSPVELNLALAYHGVVESDGSDVDVGSVADDGESLAANAVMSVSGSGRGTGRGRRGGGQGGSGAGAGDLRKKLLKNEQAKSTNRKTRAGNQDTGSPAASRFASPAPFDEDKTHFVIPARRCAKVNNIFFSNTTFYAFLRLVQVLYSRLELFKGLSAKMAKEKLETHNNPPMSDERTTLAANSASDPAANGTSNSSRNPTNPQSDPVSVVNNYEWMVEMIEQLFDNRVESAAFEDRLRSVFGIKYAYNMFTVDKVIGAMIKQVQAIISDPKSQELLENLKRERSIPNPSTQDHMNVRRNAEKVLGPDENVFRIDWLLESKTITFQLIGQDDKKMDNSELLMGRWQAYIDAYTSSERTRGVSESRVKRPYLKRNIPQIVRDTPPRIVSQDGLEIKVCVRTYRLFFVSNTGDLMWKHRSKEEMERYAKPLVARNALRKAWLEKSTAELS